MSLTNPKNVITEERLAEFYQGILPYLGGMPDVLANKFSKSDLYSTDERIVGQWIDGKPIYQKTIDCGALPNNTTKQVDSSVTGISRIINMCGYAYKSSNYQTIPIGFPASSGAVSLSFYSDTGKVNITTTTDRSAFAESYVVIQYTKTTDSPVSIGIDTDYSTTEKIVGTWIDGKPLYQKTIDFEQNILISNTTWTTTRATIQNGAMVVKCYGSSSENPYQGDLLALIESGTLKLQTPRNGTDVNASVRYCTIQYTKTTD